MNQTTHLLLVSILRMRRALPQLRLRVRCSFPAGSKPRKTRKVECKARHLAPYNSVAFETEMRASDERPDNTKQHTGNGRGITIPALEYGKPELCTDMMKIANLRLAQNRNGWRTANREALNLHR